LMLPADDASKAGCSAAKNRHGRDTSHEWAIAE
jgi:hypothetical protein